MLLAKELILSGFGITNSEERQLRLKTTYS